MKTQSLVGMLAIAVTLGVNAGEATTPCQLQTAVGLAVSDLQAESLRFPQSTLPGVDFDHPQVTLRRAHGDRRLVFVSFDSKLARWGEYVAFEVCAHSSQVVRVDSGRVSDIDLYRQVVASIDATTPNVMPSGCTPAV